MVFIRFQYPLQRHFVVLVVAGLVVDITIMQAPIAIHRFMFIPMVLQDLSVGLLQVPNKQWGYYTAAVGAIYTDVTTPVSFSRCFLAASIDILLAASTTWPGTTQTVWNINASTANKLRFIWAKAPIELDGAVWFGIFIQTVGKADSTWK